MAVINPVSPFAVALGRTEVSSMGAIPAPLAAVVGGNPYWYDAAGHVLIYQNATGTPFLQFIDLDTNVVTTADANGQNNLGAGANVWAAELAGISVRTNVGGLGPFAGSALEEVSEAGWTCIIVNQSTGSGLKVYDDTGTLVYTGSVTLTNPNVHLRQGVLSYQDMSGWHLIDVVNGRALSGFLPRSGITNLVPFTLGTSTAVLEYETATDLWSVRLATALTGLSIDLSTNAFRTDIIGTGAAAARMAWSTGEGELRTELVILDINTATGTTSIGVVSGTSMSFSTGPTLPGTTFSGTGANTNTLPTQSQKVLLPNGEMTKVWRDSLQRISGAVQAVTTTVNNLPTPVSSPSFGTIGTVVAPSASAVLAFTSSDASVTITPNQGAQLIDFVVASAPLTWGYAPVGDGGEPMTILSNGAGQPLMTPYLP